MLLYEDTESSYDIYEQLFFKLKELRRKGHIELALAATECLDKVDVTKCDSPPSLMAVSYVEHLVTVQDDLLLKIVAKAPPYYLGYTMADRRLTLRIHAALQTPRGKQLKKSLTGRQRLPEGGDNA